MLAKGALLAMVWLAQAAVDLSQPVFESGYVVTLKERSGSAVQPTFAFWIQTAGLPEDVREFRIVGLATIQQLRIYPGPVVAVVGPTQAGKLEAQLVDGRTGSILFQKECSSLAYDVRNQAFTCSVDGQVRWTYSAATGSTGRGYAAVPGLLKILSDGSVDARRKALPSIVTTRTLRESPEVRKALGDELRRAVADDRKIAATATSADRVRNASAARDYLGELITLVARLGMVDMLPALASVDHTASTLALTAFAGDSVPWVLDALGRPTPRGYSYQYRAELVYVLARILQRGFIPDEGLRGRIASVARAVLSRPDSPRELINGLHLVFELDDESFDPILRKLVSNPVVAGSRRWETDEIQKLARRILESRVVIR